MTEPTESKTGAKPYPVMVWAIRNIDGTWLHQTKRPGTIDVWMEKDWPQEYVSRMTPGKWRIVALSVDLADLAKLGPKKYTRAATWPYTIPESAIEESAK